MVGWLAHSGSELFNYCILQTTYNKIHCPLNHCPMILCMLKCKPVQAIVSHYLLPYQPLPTALQCTLQYKPLVQAIAHSTIPTAQ